MKRSRVDELVSAWCAARDRSTPVSVADLCRDCPELIPAVAQRVAALGDTHGGSSATIGFVPAVPATLGGYRVEGVLGQGGMGAVYLARDDRLGRAVAIKTMRPEVVAEPGAKDRFLRGARAAARVDHDNVVPIWQVGEDGGVPFIAMPLLQGESLADRLERERIPPVDVTLRVGREVAAGLAAAHAHGLIHRDIKPANVWLEGDPKAVDPAERFRRCKILDFGLARPADDDTHLTATSAVLGTPAYMSPEQARGETVDFRTDLFSLGAMLYRMATGEQPFAGTSVMAVLTSLAVHDPPPPSAKNLSFPAPLSNVIMKLLAKDAADRPASAGEVEAALGKIAGRPTAARKVRPDSGASAPPARTSRQVLVWAAAALVGIAALVIAGVVVNELMNGPKEKNGGPEAKAPEKVEPPKNAGTTPPKNPEPPSKPFSTDPTRRAAEWALRCGGKVQIRQDGPEIVVGKEADLPAGSFDVIRIILTGCGARVTNSGLENLVGLTGLTHCILAGTAVTDAGMEHLKGLTDLVDVNLGNTAVTGAGLVHLKKMNRLVQIYLYRTGVTDAGLEHLSCLTGLTYLDFSGTTVSDLGLEKLKGLTNLSTLGLYGTKVTGAGLAHLAEMTHLVNLELSDTGASDDGLKSLKGMVELSALELSGTTVSDAGLEHLKGLSKLTTLGVAKTLVTPAGAEKLRKSLPNCKVVFE